MGTTVKCLLDMRTKSRHDSGPDSVPLLAMVIVHSVIHVHTLMLGEAHKDRGRTVFVSSLNRCNV